MFTREDGSLIRPDSVGQRLACLCERAIKAGELATKIGLHGLRHTHATLALEANVSVKVVSERLGHASPAFTMAVYQHALPTLQAEAARSIASLVEHAGEGHEDQAKYTAD